MATITSSAIPFPSSFHPAMDLSAQPRGLEACGGNTSLEEASTPVEGLAADQHLPDCELAFLTSHSLFDDAGERLDRAEFVDDASESVAKKRKHRESMARLRKKLRESIDQLQLEERRLSRTLQHAVDNFMLRRQTQTTSGPSVDSRQRLHGAYCDLVMEQRALQEERRNLDQTWGQKCKYERLLLRELDRVSVSVDEDVDYEPEDRSTSI